MRGNGWWVGGGEDGWGSGGGLGGREEGGGKGGGGGGERDGLRALLCDGMKEYRGVQKGGEIEEWKKQIM